MGSHATYNQTNRPMGNTVFAVTLIASIVSLALCYAAMITGQSPILARAAASVNALACMMSDNKDKQNSARMAAIAGLILLAVSVLML